MEGWMDRFCYGDIFVARHVYLSATAQTLIAPMMAFAI